MANYLVTGAAGFIGAEVARQLLAAGHRVTGVDNLNNYYAVALKLHRLETLKKAAADAVTLPPETGKTPPAAAPATPSAADASPPPATPTPPPPPPAPAPAPAFRFLLGSVEDRTFVEDIFASSPPFDAVFHLAARAGVRHSIEDPCAYMATNALGALNVLEVMRRRSVQKFVLASTSSLYAGLPAPFAETLPVNTPRSPYAASKKAAEAAAFAAHHLHGTDVTVVRYFTVFGPAGRPDMAVFRLIEAVARGTPVEIYGDGSQSRDFTFVADIARGTIAAARPLGYEIVNLGAGATPLTLNSVIAAIEERLGRAAVRVARPFHKADMANTAADISKAARLLDWRPLTPFADGLDATIAWHREHRDLLDTIAAATAGGTAGGNRT
ncbi:MAG: NAD-dependent epimerase/dehydratase family protein [Puniceicoccales bacterium]|jgi:nucleoside-diphosphate-sugar epimerase|nr:NAD-dependent epimerase/dehydratase family protein [Puniceicoccales bacterium]